MAERFPQVTVGIHTHNDSGLAVANSLAAVEAGAAHVQGTYLGFGERSGNANLSTIIPNLQLKRGYVCIPDSNLPQLTDTARAMAEVANIRWGGGSLMWGPVPLPTRRECTPTASSRIPPPLNISGPSWWATSAASS